MSKKEPLTFDFGHLYKTKSVDVEGLFEVVIQEIPHGEFGDMQNESMKNIDFDVATNSKRERQSSINKGFRKALRGNEIKIADMSDDRCLLAIKSWTLKDSSGDNVPVCMEAWKALPHRMTEIIEEVIDELNPRLDDEFPGDDGS